MAILLTAGCSSNGTPPALRTEFDFDAVPVALAGDYVNRGEGNPDLRAVYLTSVLWPKEPLDHAAIEIVRVAAAGDTLRVRGLGGGEIRRESIFVRGRDFELEQGRIRLKHELGLAGFHGEPVVGPYLHRMEVGLDTEGQGKLRERTAVAGLAFLVWPVAVNTVEEIRFSRIEPESGESP